MPPFRTTIVLGTLLPGALAAATVVNIDFGRDTTGTTASEVIPEPSSTMLLLVPLVGLVFQRRR